jgi:hypothetical protein
VEALLPAAWHRTEQSVVYPVVVEALLPAAWHRTEQSVVYPVVVEALLPAAWHRTEQSVVYPVVVEALLPAAWHRTEQYGNNRVECDHGRLKARLRPTRGLKRDRSARVIIAGHALAQNVRRGHNELAVEEPANRRLAIAFAELAMAI